MHCCSFVHVGILAVHPYLNLRKNKNEEIVYYGQKETEDGSSSPVS